MEFTSAITASVVQSVGSDRVICMAARVSTLGQETVSNEQDAGLIKYLMKNKHGSPFEQGSITFLVTAPIFVFWDHVRHRIGVSYNVESSRYRELKPVFFLADRSRTQTGKPGAYVYEPGRFELDVVMGEATTSVCEQAWHNYQWMLDEGIAREQAMQVLPMNTVISAYVTFNPRSLMNFLELRLGPAREEMQRLAKEYQKALALYWPMTHDAFVEAGRVAP